MSPKSPSSRSQRFAGGAIVVLLVLGAMATIRSNRTLPRPAVVSTTTPRTASQSCAECHSDVTREFSSAPHARTLRRVDDELLARFAGRTFRQKQTGTEFRYELRGKELCVVTPAYGRELPIEWVFGSGTHAQTPLILLPDEKGLCRSIEHCVSWYPSGELGTTLGQEQVDVAMGVHAVGRLWGTAETINCFGCHCTDVPLKGEQIDFDGIEPGVGCARCHWNSAAHIEEMEAGLPATIERLSELSPAEAVDRCGECHRRASEMGGPISPDDPLIARFAPVGLVQSPCFQKQHEVTLDSGRPARLVCTTCHDPHRPSDHDWRTHVQSCLSCHDAAHGRAADCRVAERTENCLRCHMPPVIANENLSFTDHWIRVRSE